MVRSPIGKVRSSVEMMGEEPIPVVISKKLSESVISTWEKKNTGAHGVIGNFTIFFYSTVSRLAECYHLQIVFR